MSSRKKRSGNRTIQSPRHGLHVLRARLWQLSGVALILGISLFIYWPSLGGGFIFDDDVLLSQNHLVWASNGLSRIWCGTESPDYWPVTNTSFWVEWRLWGTNPSGYRVTNLVLHVLAALLIWKILRKLFIPGAFLAALVYAVHPVNVESVAWISQRKDVLATFFFLLAAWWYLRAEERREAWGERRGGEIWYWVSLAAFLLAMLSKGSAAVLPVVLLLLIGWQRRRITGLDLARTGPFFAVAVLLTMVNIWFQTHGSGEAFRSASLTERLLGAGACVWFYLAKAIVPLELCFIYTKWQIESVDPRWWLPGLTAAAVTALLWRQRKDRRGRALLLAWSFFCVALIPVMGFADTGFMKYASVADRYQHIALIGAAALASAGWAIWRREAQGPAKAVMHALAIGAIAILTLLAWQRSRIFADPIALYEDILQKNPTCVVAYNNLGLVLADRDRNDEAIRFLERALQINGNSAEAHNNLGVPLAKFRRSEEAIEHFQQALRIKPDYPEAHLNLGLTLSGLGRSREAIEEFEASLRLRPDYPEAHNALGIELARQGRPLEALEQLQAAADLKPYYAEAHNNLGVLLARLGRTQQAIEQYQQAIRFNPVFIDAQNNLGNALVQSGRPEEAIAHYEIALGLKPSDPETQNNLAVALVRIGRPQEAIEHSQQAIQLNPQYIEAYANLAAAYAQTNRFDEAVAAMQKALELARAQQRMDLIGRLETSLNNYRLHRGADSNTGTASPGSP